ncbi:ethylene-responsive transcription factor CRF1-like [Panicum miliaceum]|uniref:Ethylene-responsive transcription factor CRF1-like n=1 Tax=Panicum miliaceum TaxID=4540 RepID=A0A3L6PB06_PANMI|nr:ethylene-responsive transcription factor CRF1-like [Panicum miliaceum]
MVEAAMAMRQRKMKQERVAEPTTIRKLVRVFWDDRDATDSSGDEAGAGAGTAARGVRKFVREIRVVEHRAPCKESSDESQLVGSPVSVLRAMPGETDDAAGPPALKPTTDAADPTAEDETSLISADALLPQLDEEAFPFAGIITAPFGDPTLGVMFEDLAVPRLDHLADVDLGDLLLWPGADGCRFSDIGDGDFFAAE